MGVSENIKRVRKEKGITQKELAEKLGITQAAVSHFELSDKDSPVLKLRLSTLEKLAEALDVELTDLIGEPQYDSGYNEGFAKGEQSMQEKANKIIEFYRDNNNDIYVLQKVFSLNSIFDDQILEDIEGAYNKIIEYEKKKEQEEKKLHVGDEVLFEGDKYVVLSLEDGYASILTHDGTGGFLKYSYEFEKTGKHYPIDEILKELEQ